MCASWSMAARAAQIALRSRIGDVALVTNPSDEPEADQRRGAPGRVAPGVCLNPHVDAGGGEGALARPFRLPRIEAAEPLAALARGTSEPLLRGAPGAQGPLPPFFSPRPRPPGPAGRRRGDPEQLLVGYLGAAGMPEAEDRNHARHHGRALARLPLLAIGLRDIVVRGGRGGGAGLPPCWPSADPPCVEPPGNRPGADGLRALRRSGAGWALTRGTHSAASVKTRKGFGAITPRPGPPLVPPRRTGRVGLAPTRIGLRRRRARRRRLT